MVNSHRHTPGSGTPQLFGHPKPGTLRPENIIRWNFSTISRWWFWRLHLRVFLTMFFVLLVFPGIWQALFLIKPGFIHQRAGQFKCPKYGYNPHECSEAISEKLINKATSLPKLDSSNLSFREGFTTHFSTAVTTKFVTSKYAWNL